MKPKFGYIHPGPERKVSWLQRLIWIFFSPTRRKVEILIGEGALKAWEDEK